MNEKNMTTLSIGIIGVGNPLRKDDGIGIFLLNQLKKKSEDFPEFVSLIDGGTGGLNLLYKFERFDVVIILDAVNFHGKIGETKFFSLDEIKSQKAVSSVSTHNADLFQIIRFGQKLKEISRNIFVFGVQPEDVSFGKGFSESLHHHIDNIILEMDHQINNVIKKYKPN